MPISPSRLPILFNFYFLIFNFNSTMVYSIEKITTLIGARRYGEKDSNIAFLLTDSRSLSFQEETLFFALQP